MERNDKWYTTKILSATLVVLLTMLVLFNTHFTVEYVDLEFEAPWYEDNILEIEDKVEIIEEKKVEKVKPKPKPKVVKPELRQIDIVKKEVIEKLETKTSEVELDDVVEMGDTNALATIEVVSNDEVTTPTPAPTPKPEPEFDALIFSEVPPEFPGGEKALMKFLKRNLEYPSYENEIGLSGRVIARFTVGRDGNIVNVKILKSPSDGFSRAVRRVIRKMPKWKPGLQDGNAVAVHYTLPVRFHPE